MKKTMAQFEDELLDLIENRDDYSRSDLQGRIGAIALQIAGLGALGALAKAPAQPVKLWLALQVDGEGNPIILGGSIAKEEARQTIDRAASRRRLRSSLQEIEILGDYALPGRAE